MRDYIAVYINGEKHEVRGEHAFMNLSEYLRYVKGLVGTKVVCSEGDCGACTVLVANVHRLENGEFDYEPVNSCISFMHILDGCHVVTVEGLKNGEDLNPVQQSMVDSHGAQCGFCTPGFVCSINAGIENHLKKNNTIDERRIKNSLTGNLCRCTGYKSIIEAGLNVDLSKFEPLTKKYPSAEIVKDLEDLCASECRVTFNSREMYLPSKFSDALKYQETQKAELVSGASDLGVLNNKRGYKPDRLMGLHNIPELYKIVKGSRDVFVGARVNLHQIENELRGEFREFTHMIHIFASPQIKNRATLIGNVANASPIGDSIPFLLVMNAKVVIASSKGEREVDINDFYKGYKTLDLGDNELIKGVRIPFLEKNESIKLYKVSNRKDMDISTVTFASKLKLNSTDISSIALAVGGVGPTVLRPVNTEKALLGKKFEEASFLSAAGILKNEVSPIDDVRGSARFRRVLSKNLLMKFFVEKSFELSQGGH
ncbi:xanthine dehydrogenase small subunit [Halobacteriovorax sp. HLS]|uniref:xanthine dehydrogenase small subunit n=1 Tax=Halobacteriovorax sp. HLS TaxID=2234000 RepID=UPI0013E2A9F2|nr:FAD binding domain-containing protein [Halobacteriovorax sp. HLS]